MANLCAAKASMGQLDVDSRALTSLKTQSGAYSQAFAISQGLLNANLAFSYGDDAVLGTSTIDGSGSVNARYMAPQVVLTTAYPKGAMCNITLDAVAAGGSHSIVTANDAHGNSRQFDVSGFTFVYAVDFKNSILKAAENRAEYDRMKDWLSVDSDDIFSVQALAVDVDSAKYLEVYDGKNPTTINTTDSTQMTNIALLVADGFQDAVKRQDPVLSYSWTTSEPAAVSTMPVSFPPTAQVFQTYPYLGPNQKQPIEGIGIGDYNTLLYLQMTDKLRLPSSLNLPYSGNFVQETIPASLCIGANTFFDTWLIPQLGSVNQAAYVKAESVTATLVKDPGNHNKLTLPQAGYNYAQESLSAQEMAWVPTDRGWTWSRSDPRITSPTILFNNRHGVCSFAAGMSVTIKNSISVLTDGEARVTFQGTTVLALDSTETVGTQQFPANCNITNTWSFTMTVQSIVKGGVELAMQGLGTQPGDMYKVTSTASVGFGNHSISTTSSLQDQIQKYCDVSTVQKTASDLEKKLNDTFKLVLPGSKDFAYAKAMFNNENDLMLTATPIS